MYLSLKIIKVTAQRNKYCEKKIIRKFIPKLKTAFGFVEKALIKSSILCSSLCSNLLSGHDKDIPTRATFLCEEVLRKPIDISQEKVLC